MIFSFTIEDTTSFKLENFADELGKILEVSVIAERDGAINTTVVMELNDEWVAANDPELIEMVNSVAQGMIESFKEEEADLSRSLQRSFNGRQN